MRFNLLIILILAFQSSLFSQESYDANELVISLESSTRLSESDLLSIPGVKRVQPICPDLHAYKVTKHSDFDLLELKTNLSKKLGIHSVQFNYTTTHRFSPNDEFFSSQWALEKIKAPEVWDITTGGTNFDGREIVLAILDDGFDVDHEDLQANIWQNEFEIIGNGIDDDNNGYVDDRMGWNFDTNNDTHPALTHGTAVAGISGASADNLDGIAGINHEIKMMVLSGVNQLSEIIEAYNYILDQRKKYNDTNGAEGAFVVATNFSAGIGEQFGTSFPVWCGLYDLMGTQGIISSTAVDNDNYNVDLLGDMPTTCQSEFLITVTNTDQTDGFDGAFGSQNVDIGAPGASIITTDINDEYDNFPGTSAAAPHVGAAAALLHSVQCPILGSTAINNPSESARTIKDAIMNGADPIAVLSSNTVSGGRLNLLESLKNVQLYCGGSIGDLSLAISFFGQGEIVFDYETPNFEPHQIQIYDTMGKLILVEEIIPPSFGDKEISFNPDWPTGMYFIKLNNTESEVVLKFFFASE